MRIGFYNPYLSALGGGERYFLTILEEAARRPGELLLFSPDEPDPAAWAQRLGISIPREAFAWVPADDGAVTQASGDLDLLVTLANDVPVLNRARRAVAVVQFPTRPRDRPSERVRAALLEAVGRARAPAALGSYDRFVCNSQFTRAHIARRLGVDAIVISPPVDAPANAHAPAKEPRIVAVGRFFAGEHAKRHDVLLDAFAELRRRPGAAEWTLHVAGGADDRASTRRLLDGLRERARRLPVHLHVNAPVGELRDLYARSTLFWHAAGYGEDPQRHPERLEHFGIATAEAMMHGAVPLVVPLGGQAEVVRDGRDGRHWRTVPELVEATAALIADPSATQRLGETARTSAQRFAKPRFLAAVRDQVLGPG